MKKLLPAILVLMVAPIAGCVSNGGQVTGKVYFGYSSLSVGNATVTIDEVGGKVNPDSTFALYGVEPGVKTLSAVAPMGTASAQVTTVQNRNGSVGIRVPMPEFDPYDFVLESELDRNTPARLSQPETRRWKVWSPSPRRPTRPLTSPSLGPVWRHHLRAVTCMRASHNAPTYLAQSPKTSDTPWTEKQMQSRNGKSTSRTSTAVASSTQSLGCFSPVEFERSWKLQGETDSRASAA